MVVYFETHMTHGLKGSLAKLKHAIHYALKCEECTWEFNLFGDMITTIIKWITTKKLWLT